MTALCRQSEIGNGGNAIRCCRGGSTSHLKHVPPLAIKHRPRRTRRTGIIATGLAKV